MLAKSTYNLKTPLRRNRRGGKLQGRNPFTIRSTEFQID